MDDGLAIQPVTPDTPTSCVSNSTVRSASMQTGQDRSFWEDRRATIEGAAKHYLT